MKKTIFTLFLLAFTGAAFAQPAVTPKDVVMPSRAAFEWVKRVAGPIIGKHSKDPNELAAVRTRLNMFIKMNDTEEIIYLAAGFYHPTNHTWLAHTDYGGDRKEDRGKLVLTVFVPALLMYQRKASPRDFEDEVVLTYVEEMIHVEQRLSGQFPLRSYLPWNASGMQEEASAFGKTILEIIRPWSKQGRNPDQEMLASSRVLADLHDDYKDPRWIQAFANYYKQ